jgi:hypothetical protein
MHIATFFKLCSLAGKVSITDIAELCVEATVNPKLSHCTAIATSTSGRIGDAPQQWGPLINKVICIRKYISNLLSVYAKRVL